MRWTIGGVLTVLAVWKLCELIHFAYWWLINPQGL